MVGIFTTLLPIAIALGIGLPALGRAISAAIELNTEAWKTVGQAVDTARRVLWNRRWNILMGSLCWNLLALFLICLGVYFHDRILVAAGGMMHFGYLLLIQKSAETVAKVLEGLVQAAYINVGLYADALKAMARHLGVTVNVGTITAPQPKFVDAVRALRNPMISSLGMIVILLIFPYAVAAAIVLPLLFIIYTLAFIADSWSDLIDTSASKKFTYWLIGKSIPILLVLSIGGSVLFPSAHARVDTWMSDMDNYFFAPDPFESHVRDRGWVYVTPNTRMILLDSSEKKIGTISPKDLVVLIGISQDELTAGKKPPTIMHSNGIQELIQIHKEDDSGAIVEAGYVFAKGANMFSVWHQKAQKSSFWGQFWNWGQDDAQDDDDMMTFFITPAHPGQTITFINFPQRTVTATFAVDHTKDLAGGTTTFTIPAGIGDPHNSENGKFYLRLTKAEKAAIRIKSVR